MKNSVSKGLSEDWAPPNASVGIAFQQQLQGRWHEITEQHWEVLLFWTEGWLEHYRPDKASEAPVLLSDFALDCWLSIELKGKWAMPLTLNRLITELKEYLAFTIRTYKKLS